MTNILRQEADHAVRLLIELAHREGQLVAVREISESAGVTLKFAHKIIQKLRDAGIVECKRGAAGGVMLAKEPIDVALIDVIELMQGPLVLSNCSGSRKTCPRESACRLSTGMSDLQSRISNLFEGVTLKTVLN